MEEQAQARPAEDALAAEPSDGEPEGTLGDAGRPKDEGFVGGSIDL
jgi:hypothetical protein